MPFVSAELIQFLVEQGQRSRKALFVRSEGGVGFPLVLRARHLEAMAEHIKKQELSLQALAKRIRARIVLPPRGRRGQLLNINTPGDWEEAWRVWRQG
jgi:molybdopterin-guanine dinucleotide biosynthesis protein A